jgi:capsular polysaccharide biosynthesis protein
MFVGAGAGLGGALALEFLHPTFHSALDVERQLEIPVLALIPDLRAQGEKVKEDAPLPQEG